MTAAKLRRQRTLRGVLIALVLVLLMAPDQVPAQAPAQAPPRAAPSSPAVQWDQLRHEVFTHRRAQLQLARASELINSGQYANAFDILQNGVLGNPQELMDGQKHDLVDAIPDSFFWDNRLLSVRREAIRVLESMPLEAQREYEQLWGPVADKALKAVLLTGSLPALMEVGRRCFPTAAGAKAIDLAATQLLDQGQPAAAATYWEQLIASPLHRRRLSTNLLRKTAMAWLLSDDSERAEKILAEGRRRGFSIELADLREAAESMALARAAVPPDGWPLPFGNVANNPMAQGTLPYLSPLWTQKLTGTTDYGDLAEWERNLVRSELRVMGAAVWPIIARNQLIVRDLDGIRSCDPRTGQQLWRFNGTLSSRQLAGRFQTTGYTNLAGKAVEYAWSQATGLGCITSDGDRVFAVDWMRMDVDSDASGVFGRRYSVANRIVCLPIPEIRESTGTPDAPSSPAVVTPIWSAGGSISHPVSDALGGQLFLGPPLPVADAVFVMSESLPTQELNLVKLEAATGRVIWIQKLGLVERNIFESAQNYRFNPVCVPACSNNVIVCPTEARYVVAVDAASGELLWIYDYSDQLANLRSWSRSLSPEQGFRGLPDPPHIQGDSVLLLPRGSRYIHCLDLRTGERVWRARRKDLYVAAVTETVVATVGEGGMRGLSLRTGEELWTARLGLPSGRGVRTQLKAQPAAAPAASEDAYLVPLKRGGVAAVHLETGRVLTTTIVPSILDSRFARHANADDPAPRPIREFDMQKFGLGNEYASSESRPGNLLLHGGLAISVGPQHLTAFAQVDALLTRLRTDAGRDDDADLLELAQVELAAGELSAAETRLSQIIAARGESTERARWLLQELIRMQLATPETERTTAEQRDMATRLAALAKTPREEEQALIHLTRWEYEHGSVVRAVPQVASIAALNLNSFISLDSYAEQVVSSDAWGRSLVHIAQRTASPNEWQSVIRQVEQDRERALQADTVTSLDRFVSIYASLPEAEPLRNRLADRLIEQGHFQAAELLLLQNRDSADQQVRAVAEVLLGCLWDRLGVNVEAGHVLQRLAGEFSDVSLQAIGRDRLTSVQASLSSPLDDATGRGFLRAFDKSSLSWHVYQDLQPLGWRVHTVNVSNTGLAGINPGAPTAWHKAIRRVDTSASVGFDLVRSGGDLRNPNRWVVIDRLSGAERARLEMPERAPLSIRRYRYVGHLMPVGGKTEMHAVSLLESQDGRPFWKHRFRPVETTNNDAIEPSVATPTVFVFQTVKHLIGIEPRSGRVLWRRSDLDLESGVRVDREAGLFGDSESLTLFHKDAETYSILSSLTGQTLRTGTANVDFRYPKRVFGRKLFHVTRESTTAENTTFRRIRVWDPAKDRFDFDVEIVGRLNFASSNSDEIALLIGHKLMVFRMPEVEQIAEIEFQPTDLTQFTTLRMFSDEQNVYLNLQERTTGVSNDRNNYYLAGDSSIPLDSVFKGKLMAVSKASGKVLWKRSVQPRSVLNISQCDLPFLVGLSRVSPRGNNTQRALEVELIDRQTGEVLGHSDRLIPDRIVRCVVDREQGRLTLHGLSSRIDLDFSRATQSILLEPGPL